MPTSPEKFPFVIVTGMEHSGTTYLASLIKANSSAVNGAFECGVLLSETSPKDFHRVAPFYDWLCQPISSGQWGLTQEQRRWACDTEDWREFYRRLAEKSPVVEPGQGIIDKTPAYAYRLRQIMERAPTTPVFVVEKDPRLLFKSYKARGVPLDRFLARYGRYAKAISEAQRDHRKRLYKVSHFELCKSPREVLDGVLRFLGLTVPSTLSSDFAWERLPPLSSAYDFDKELRTVSSFLEPEELEQLRRLDSDREA